MIFTRPNKSAEGVLGGRPKASVEVPEQLSKFLVEKRLLEDGEIIKAAIDDSWLDDGSRGTVLTDRRMLTFKGESTTLSVRFSDVARVFVRRFWFPGVPLVRRAEFLGNGPVVVLRLRFDLVDDNSKKLRFSEYAGKLYPVLNGLMEACGDKVEVGRVLPGI